MRTLFVSLSRPSDSMDYNGKHMPLEATCLTETQPREIIVKLSKPNVLSKRALGREYEVSGGAIRKVMETMRIKEEPPTDDEIQPKIETFVGSESATDVKGFEALLSSTSTTNCFAPMFKRKFGQMYDEP